MSILAADKIEERLNEIFIDGTYDVSNIAEATYCLRLSNKYLYVNETWYDDDEPVFEKITIKRGDIVCLSTIEEFKMPNNLVGHYDLKFKKAIRGLVLLNGGRVDPGYGAKVEGKPDNTGQKLFVFVMNMGPDVDIDVGEQILIVEFHVITGEAKVNEKVRQDNHIYVRRFIEDVESREKYGFLPDYTKRVKKVESKIDRFAKYQNFLLLGIGAILLITLLGVSASFLLAYTSWSSDRQETYPQKYEESHKPFKSIWHVKDTVSVDDSLFVLFNSAVNPKVGEYLQIVKKTKVKAGDNYEDVGVAKVVRNVNGEVKAVVLDQNEIFKGDYFLVKK